MSMENVLTFLKKLARNNNREWFEKNKSQYLEVKEYWDDFAAKLFDEVTHFDDSIAGQDPKKLTFRIYRDVRFSKDKTPYKKNMSAAFSPSGKGMGTPGYYFHIQPGNESFIAIGQFQPDAGRLAAIRQEIDYNGERLEKVFKDKAFKKHFGDFWDEDALKTMPKGYDKEHKHARWLRLKSFIVTHEFTDAEVLNKNFMKQFVSMAKTGKPLKDFLMEANS